MAVRTPGVWALKIVRPDTGAPVSGVPVTLLDSRGETVGHWVSDAAGMVEIPRSDSDRIRLRVGLRQEEPFEILPGELRRGVVELPAPRILLPATTRSEAEEPTPPVEAAHAVDLPPQVLQFQRLGILAPQPPVTVREAVGLPPVTAPDPAATTGIAPVDFFSVAVNYPAPIRYGLLVELEQHWRHLGYALGDLLYSVPLAPGDQARVAILDGRQRYGPTGAMIPEEPVPRERPLQELARLVSARGLVDALDGLDLALPLESFAIGPEKGGEVLLGEIVAESLRYVNERAQRVSGFLRNRRAFGVSEVREAAEASSAPVRLVRNTQADHTVSFEYFEMLQRYRVTAQVRRVRPAILLPFRMPNLATLEVVRQYCYLLRRVVLDRTLLPELDQLAGVADGERDGVGAVPGAQVTELRLVAHVAAGDRALDLWQASCYLHVDAMRYAVHFTPAEAPAGGVTSAAIPRTTHWIGTIRPTEFHARPLRYPGQLVVENASLTDLVFETLHVEGRVAESWQRLQTFTDLVLTAESRMQLVGLGIAAQVPGTDVTGSRLLAHIAANLPYYSAAIIAGGDSALRYLALAKVRDPAGNPVVDVVENSVVGFAGNYVAFPLRSVLHAPPDLQALFAQVGGRIATPSEESVVTVPTPGVWLRTQLNPTVEGSAPAPRPRVDSGSEAPDQEASGPRAGWRAGLSG